MNRSPFPAFRPLKAIPLVLVAAALGACGKPPAGGGPGGMPAPEVTVATVQPRALPLAIELPATLAGSREVEIRARVSGILKARHFTEGGPVRSGQSLFALDDASFAAALARSDAELAAAQARLEQAERNLGRLKPLRAENAVSQKELDDALAAAAIAAAELKAAEARVRDATLNLAYARVESPISGIAGRALVSEGSFVPGPELLLARVSQLDPIHVRFGLAEPEQARLQRDADAGQVVLPAGGRWKASVRLADGSLHDEAGVVNFSDVRVNPETGTGEYQAVVGNAKARLRPGQFVRVLLEGATRRDALAVPQRAVLDSGTGKYVYLLGKGENGLTIAQPAPVEVGDWVRLEGGQNGWVIRKGLKAGDPVIVDGVARIFFPGMPVKAAGAAPTAAHSPNPSPAGGRGEPGAAAGAAAAAPQAPASAAK